MLIKECSFSAQATRLEWIARISMDGLATALLLAFTTAAGCSMRQGDPENPKRNPHPVKRYEVTATADAPGPWGSVKGVVFFDVINKDCAPQDSFTGGQNVPNVGYDFEMVRMNDKTWRGYVYRDFLQDEDYFGKGACHWDLTGFSPIFSMHGETFNVATAVEGGRIKDDPRIFFKKIDYINSAITTGGALQSTFNSPDVLRHPEAFFPIGVTFKEVMP